MAARKRNVSNRSKGNFDAKSSKEARATSNNTIDQSKVSNDTTNQFARNNQNSVSSITTSSATSRMMNILVTLFIIAMLNPLLFNTTHLLLYHRQHPNNYNILYKQLTPQHDFPEEWETYTYKDIRYYFNCRLRSKDNNKPLPSLDDWNLLRQTYTLVVDENKVWDDPIPPTLGYSFTRSSSSNNSGKASPPPYYAKQSKGKGRGLFASRDITKGELVHNGDISDVLFPGDNAISWKRFVFSLPRDLACDCTDWHWMQMKYEGDSYHMVGALDISVLMNSGGEEFGLGRAPNALPESEYSGRQFAVRDIQKDEEILTDYDAYWTEWSVVGL